MNLDVYFLWFAAGVTLLALLRFAPASILIVGLAITLSAPSIEKVMDDAPKATPVVCTP